LHDWVTGMPSEQVLVPAVDMRYWKIYETSEQMENYYRQYVPRQEVKEKEAKEAGSGK
jgi:hypothetical protein